MIKLHHLRHFIVIAREKSIRSAARSLNLAQPAVTRSLSELEANLGAPLVERFARGIVLTAAGERFLLRANASLAELQHGEEEVAQINGINKASINVGISTAILLSIVPEAYATFRQQYRDVKFRFIEATFDSIEPRLKDGQVDLYVGPRPLTRLGPSYRVTLLFKNTRAVYARAGHPLKNVQRLADLIKADWIIPGPSSRIGDEMLTIFETHGLIAPEMNTRSESMLGLLMLLMKTDALTILPVQWTDAFAPQQLIIPLPIKEDLNAPDIVMITKAGSPLTPLAESFALLLEKIAIRIKRTSDAKEGVDLQKKVP